MYPDDPNAWTIRGRITRAGKPIAGASVAAYDRDLRKRQSLGHDVSGSDGLYQIGYRDADFAQGERRERSAPWLIVQATLPDEGPTVVVEKSGDIQRNERIDLSFDSIPSTEFERLADAVQPLLDGQGDDGGPLSPWELKSEDSTFIARETGMETDQVRLWIRAANTARAVNMLDRAAVLPEQTAAGPPAEYADDKLEWIALYGWFRENLPIEFARLLANPTDLLMTRLAEAIANGRIPALTTAQRDRIRVALGARRITDALAPAPGGRPATLGNILPLVGGKWLTPTLQQTIAPILLDIPVESDEFLDRLTPLVRNESHRRDLRRTLRLSDLALRHAPMIEALQHFAEESEDDTLRGLAAIEPVRWVDLAYEHGTPPSSSLTPEEYARQMKEAVERATPTASLVQELETHPFFSATPSYASLIPVLRQHPAFDVATDDVEAFAKVARLDAPREAALQRLQGLKRLGVAWDEAGTLMERSIDSVRAVIDLGPGGFKSELEEVLSVDRIEMIYRRALATQVASVGLMGAIQPMLFQSSERALRSKADGAAERSIIDNNPTLRKLFGPLETCACDPCLSVLGPAAYLVDLLKFVDASTAAGLTLRQRRPDLYDLELSCDNSDIEVLHIDLVNEILENKVALPLTVSLPPGVNAQDEIKRTPLGPRVRSELQRTALEEIGELTAVEDVWSQRPTVYYSGTTFWVVTDRHRRWVLQASTERLWLLSAAYGASVDVTGLNMVDVVNALDTGTLHPSVRDRFQQALIDTQRPEFPVHVEDLSIVRTDVNAWTVSFALVSTAEVNLEEGTLVLTGDPGNEETLSFAAATIDATREAFGRGYVPPIVTARSPAYSRKVAVARGSGRGWSLRSAHTVRAVYRTSALSITGLTYQSTVRGEDLLARPQNRNPLAYTRLNAADVAFPWTLPYDADLSATRALLSNAGTSRLTLLELMNIADYSATPPSIVREYLGLSLEDVARIRATTAGDDLWAVWGLKKASQGAGPYTVFDTFADQTVDGAALTILGRVSVLMQQARVSFVELQQLLASRWINPAGLQIAPDNLCDPAQLTVAVDEPLLDRLHRFVRLWRAIGWRIWELDLALRTPVIASDPLDDGTLRNLAHVKRLAARLTQPVEVLVAWFSAGFTNDSHLVERKGELLDIRSLYDRLFFDRRMTLTPDPDLAYTEVTHVPPSANTLAQKVAGLAAAFGVRESIVGGIIDSTAIDPAGVTAGRQLTNRNLAWLYRNCLLMKLCRLSPAEYESAWKVRPGTPFASPGDLLAFLDDLDQVRASNTTWRTLEYVLRGTLEEQIAFSTAQASAVLGAIQRALAAGAQSAPPGSSFGLTADDLLDPALSVPPASAAERWTRWGLARAHVGTDWTVENPDPNAVNRQISGPPLTLLSMLSVLAQQLGASVGDVRSLLQTRYVAPDGAPAVRVVPTGGGAPGFTATNLTAVHLDRLERLAALWRRTGLGARELDLLIRALAVTDPADPLTDDLTVLVAEAPAMITVRDRLGLTLDTVIAWLGGLGGRRYRSFDPSGIDGGEDPGVFDRLFSAIPVLALNTARDRLAIEAAPPMPAPSWSDVMPALASALRVPASELAFLLAAGTVDSAVTLRNVETIHRATTLSTALGLTTKDFVRFTRRFAQSTGQNWRTSPTTVLRFVEATLEEHRRTDTIASQVAGAFQLDASVAEDLLWGAFDVPGGGGRLWAMDLFLQSPLLTPAAVLDPTTLAATPEYAVLVRLYKLRLLNAGWKATPDELRWLWKDSYTAPPFTGLTLNALPVSSADPPVAFIDWRRTTLLFARAHTTAATSATLDGYHTRLGTARTSAEVTAAFEYLGVVHGLPQASAANAVEAFAALLGLDTVVPPPNAPNQLDSLLVTRLLTLVETCLRLGLDAATLAVLLADPATEESVATARTVLRSRFGESTWVETLRKANNQVREMERDRLADYLIWREGVRDANALYERYLIDVTMGACMKTTRLLQSIAAVQLFVQRSLFNLEQPYVSAGAIPNQDRWEWMRSYRVWEANRKVFLYPENWLYPELRDDRSETFRAFESALLQSEPSHENALNALRQYLDDLVDVGQITVLGMFEHEDRGEAQPGRPPRPAVATLFLIGRSQNPPYRFFWRKATPYGVSGTRWTSWQRIEADLSGDHVVPFVLGGDLHVAWPVIKQTRQDDTDYFELQLGIARLAASGWTKRQTSRERLAVRKLLYRSERTTFALRLRNVEWGQSVAIDTWSIIKPVVPQTTLDNANKISVISVDRYVARRGSELGPPHYWVLRLTVSGFLKYHDTGRIVPSPCLVTLSGISSDNGQADYFKEDGTGSIPPITASDLSARALNIFGLVVLRIRASFEVDQQILLSDELSVDFTAANNALGNEDADGGDQFELSVTFLVNGPDDPLEPGEWDPLDMALRGSFIVKEGREIELIGPPRNSVMPHAPGFVFVSSGQREFAPGSLGAAPAAESSGSGRLFALGSAPQDVDSVGVDTTYLEEEDRRWLIRTTHRPQEPGVGGTPSTPEARTAIYTASFQDPVTYKDRAARRLDDFFAIDTQRAPFNSELGLATLGQFVTSGVHPPVDPRDSPLVQFDLSQPYAAYNWEMFFHVPLAAAVFLSRQQRFEDARRWFHYIFDPTTTDPSLGQKRFWRFLPFRHANQPDSITRLLELLGGRAVPAGDALAVQGQVNAWLADPFNPFAIARLRPSAFEWYTVISYVKNLLQWGDQLFRRDTRESINEATLLYVLAATILGRRPERIAARGAARLTVSYRALAGRWDDFGNVWLSLADNPLVQQWIAFLEWLARHGVAFSQSTLDQITQLSSIGSLYFCVPSNEKLPELWDNVQDRLFKIRHCQNIEGVVRDLPLFEPPIDPELLIRARAAGLDLADVLADRFAPLPHQRFQVLLQKANEFCGDVKALGAALLSAIEKKEGEQLALLRSHQEIDMLHLVEAVREDQLNEANANIEALQKTRRNALDRFTYLQRQLGKTDITLDPTGAPIVEQALMTQAQDSGAPDDFRSLALVHAEIDQVQRLQEGHVWSVVSGIVKASSGVAHAAAAAAAAPAPYDSVNKALSAVGHGLSAVGDGLALVATNASFWERRASLISTWQRRRDEWVQQSKMTAEEIRQIDKQLVALQIRQAIAQKELDNHRKQIEFTANVDDFLRRLKFTGESLHTWMEGQLASVYFGAYQLAYDLARRAERTFRFEIGDETTSFVRFGHWEGLRKGLLAGERLSGDLRRMEGAYFDRNRRELEMTKHVSLRQLDPWALIELRTSGGCEFELSEALFDMDFPGHYYRRLKTVSVSVPSVIGPYTSVSGTLTLLSSRVRDKSLAAGDYADEENYRANFLPVQSIATSSAQNDSGLFELNFRDDRYLPFEGAGALSRWRFTLPGDFRAFDYDTIADVILHVRYTARDGGEQLEAQAVASVADQLNSLVSGAGDQQGLAALISLRQDFDLEWRRFRDGAADLTLPLTERFFPYVFRSRVKVQSGRIVWSGQTNDVPLNSDDADLPTFSVLLADGDELRAVGDPYLIVNYRV